MPAFWGVNPGSCISDLRPCFWIYAGETVDLEEYGTNYYGFKPRRFIREKEGRNEGSSRRNRNKGKQMAKDEGHIRLRSLSKCDDIGNL